MKEITEVFNKYASQYTTIENTMNIQQFTQAVTELLEKQRELIVEKLATSVPPEDGDELISYVKLSMLIMNTKLEGQQ